MAYADCFSDVLRQYWTDVVLFLDFRRGKFSDLSSYTQTVTISGTPVWRRSRFGKCLDFVSRSGTLAVTDASNLRLQSGGTLVCFAYEGPDGKSYSTNPRIISKRDAGGQAYDWDYVSPGKLNLDSYIICDTAGVGSVMNAVVMPPASYGRFFKDGSLLGISTTTGSIPNDDAPVYIGSLYGVAGYDTAAHLTDLIFSRSLTDDEISRLYDDWLLSAHESGRAP